MPSLRCLLPALALALLPAAASAQARALDRGSLLVDGQGSFTSSRQDRDEERTVQLFLNPGVQYFVAPGLAVGGELAFSRSARDDDSSTSYGVGPAVSYYFRPAEGSVVPFAGASLLLARSEAEFGGIERESSQFGYRAAGGLLLLVSEGVGITTELFYQAVSQDFGGAEYDGDAFGLALGIAAFVF